MKNTEYLLKALKIAKEELIFLYTQQQNEKFFCETSQANMSVINDAIRSAEEKSFFKVEYFEGSGQYVIENREPHYKDTGYMTTLMYKVCYGTNTESMLVSMSDGMVLKEFTSGSSLTENKRLLCDFLNENNYRPVSQEELVRMAVYQHHRCG